jgi:DNA-binding XRE family transcriptional regulator
VNKSIVYVNKVYSKRRIQNSFINQRLMKKQGEILKGFRLNLGFTQDVFAKKIGASKATISSIETGSREISEEMAHDIKTKFESFPIDEILESKKKYKEDRKKNALPLNTSICISDFPKSITAEEYIHLRSTEILFEETKSLHMQYYDKLLNAIRDKKQHEGQQAAPKNSNDDNMAISAQH